LPSLLEKESVWITAKGYMLEKIVNMALKTALRFITDFEFIFPSKLLVSTSN